MSDSSYIEQCIQTSIEVKQSILGSSQVQKDIQAFAQLCIEALKKGRKILIAGNGGSAADAQHIAAELVCRFEQDRPGLPSIALTTDSSMLTAISNDYGYEQVFARQIEANAIAGDVFVGISTSGTSANIVKAMEAAKSMGVRVVGLCGENAKLSKLSDVCVAIPSSNTARIQESHILVGHIVCGLIEKNLFNA